MNFLLNIPNSKIGLEKKSKYGLSDSGWSLRPRGLVDIIKNHSIQSFFGNSALYGCKEEVWGHMTYIFTEAVACLCTTSFVLMVALEMILGSKGHGHDKAQIILPMFFFLLGSSRVRVSSWIRYLFRCLVVSLWIGLPFPFSWVVLGGILRV